MYKRESHLTRLCKLGLHRWSKWIKHTDWETKVCSKCYKTKTRSLPKTKWLLTSMKLEKGIYYIKETNE